MDYGALIQAIVGIAGEFVAGGEREKAEQLLRQARLDFQGIKLPELDEIEAQQLGPSALESVNVDPTLEAAQYDALGQVGDVAENGMPSADRAALNRIANQVNRRQRAGQAGIEADMAGRGLAGSGVDYATRAGMASDANQRLSEEGQNIAGESAQRRFNAILAKGDLSGRMRGQQYSEKANAAKARDDIMRFNAQMRDSNNRYNQGQRQQRFQNVMQKTGAVANPTNALAGFKVQSANDTRQAAAGYGQAAGKFVNSWDTGGDSSNYGSEDLSDEENKRRGRKLYEEDDR